MPATLKESPSTTSDTAGGRSSHGLQCMEIWGGNQTYDSAISVPGIDAWVYSRPHDGQQAGGDIHYVSMCGSGRITRFAVADVSGHGAAVGELAGRLRTLMRRYINTLNQTRFAKALNDQFGKLAADGKFATAILATYFSPNDHLIMVNAGHPAPLWYRAAAGQWQWLRHDVPERASRVSNLPLGIISPTNYHQFAVQLGKGDLVLFYTDSLIEARSPRGELLGESGLMEMIQRLDVSDPERLRGRLIDALDEYRGHAPPDDDMTILLLHHNGTEAPWPGFGSLMKSVIKMLGLMKV